MRTSFYDYCVKQDHGAMLAQWDTAKNGTLTPETVLHGSNRRV